MLVSLHVGVPFFRKIFTAYLTSKFSLRGVDTEMLHPRSLLSHLPLVYYQQGTYVCRVALKRDGWINDAILRPF